MASFMDYYEDELKKAGSAAPRPVKAKGVSLSSLNSDTPKKDEGGPMSAVNWVMDMLSRTTYGMTNANRANVDKQAQGASKIQQGDVLGGAADYLSGLPTMPSFLTPGAVSPALDLFKDAMGNNTDQKFVEGVTSNDPALKQSNSQLIEYATDKFGTTLDPNYENVQDNINPVAKGIGGFAMDVAGDPLTYVAGEGLIGGVKGILKAADRGLSAASKGLSGAKKASQPVEEILAGAGKVKKGKKSEGLDEENPFDNATTLDPGSFRPAGVTPRLALESAQEAAPAAAKTAFEGVDPQALGNAKPFDTSVGPVKNQPDISHVVDEAGAIPVGGASIQDLIGNSPNRQPIADLLTGLADDVANKKAVADYKSWSQKLPDSHLVRDPAGANQPVSIAALKRDMELWSNPQNRTPQLKKNIDRTLVYLRHEYQTTVAPSGSVVDALTAFQARAAADKDAVRAAIGGDLYDFLAHPKQNSPARFHKVLDQIRQVIEPSEDVMDVLRNMDQNLARVLTQRLGVPRAAKAKTPEEAAAIADQLLTTSDPYQAALSKGLAKALDMELKDLREKGYSYFIKKQAMDVARTSNRKGEGLGRYVDQLNGFSQYTMLRNQQEAIDLAALNIMRARGIKGNGFQDLYSAQRTEIYKEAILRVMDDQAKLLDDIGAHMSIGIGADTVQLSMAEVYRGLGAAADDLGLPRTIDQGLYNYGTQAAPTAVSDAVAAAIGGASRDDVLAILTDAKKYGNKGLLKGSTGKRPNNLIDSGHGWGSLNRSSLSDIGSELTRGDRKLADNLFVRRKEAGRTSQATGSTRKANHYYLQYRKGDRNYMAEALADTIMHAQPGLKVRAAENELNFVARTRQEVHKLSTDELQKIESFLKDPSGTIAKIRAFKARQQRIEAEAATINASPDAVKGAEDLVDASLGEDLVDTMAAAGRADPQYTSAETALDLSKANQTFTGSVWDDVDGDFAARPTENDLTDPLTGLRQNEEWAEVIDEGDDLFGDWRDMLYDEASEFITGTKKVKVAPKKGRKGAFVDLSENAPAMVDKYGDKIIDPYGAMKHKIQLWFNQNYMADNAMRIAHAWQNSMSMRTAYVSHQLNAISKAARKISDDPGLLRNTFASIQRGDVYGGTDPAVKGLDDMIRGVLDDFFDLTNNGSLGNVFLRTTSKPELINAMLKQKGIDEAFDLGAAQKLAAETGLPLDQALAGQWKSWKVNDPLDFMHRMAQARQELAFNKGTAMSFMEMARNAGAVSNKRAPGFVRIQASGDSRFAAHLPEGVYVKKELAEELRRVETVYRTSREFSGQLGDFVKTTYAPLLNAWKFAITLPRPGHHIRNLIGDTSVTWMRRGNAGFAPAWKDAVKLLATRNSYTDVNMLEAATRYGIKDIPKGTDVLYRTDGFEITADEAYGILAEGGALPTYHIGEDFVDARGPLDSLLGKVTLRDTAVGEQLGKLSEGRDHLARFQHFMQILRQDAKGWKGTREQLLDNALREVIKYHPDASLLTTAESKIRLAIPFYSWFGKIIPALTESMIMHPGRLSTFNKGSFNWAVANGLDPESLSDPFPDDQLFPSFLTEQALGPQFIGLPLPGSDGQYIRTNPGIAHLDVMNTLGADPLRGVAGMISPIVRVPAELLSGGSWGTGAPINDWSDYLDQSLPGVNYIANISGVSPTGSVESVLKGEGLDPQAQVEKGNKTDFDKALAVANWITGLGFQNLSRPNYINYAEIEKRNAEASK